MRKTLATIVALALAGCGSPDYCAMGALTGTWQGSYTEQPGGTCGPVSTQTGTGYIGLPPGCSGMISIGSDRCSTGLDYTCIVSTSSGVTGSVRYVGELHQTSATRIEGTETVYLTTNAGNCTSTYKVVVTKV